MARSDLKINYGDLRGIYSKLISTANALRRLESASKEFCEVMQKQDGASFDALNTYWEEFVNPGNTALLYQLDSTAALLKEYINAMESIIAPVDEYRMSRVDREDIGFNLEQVKFNIDRLAENYMNCGVRDSWRDYWQVYVPNPFDEDWENEARRDRIDSENIAESGRRQRNYKKVIDIWDKIGGEYYSYYCGMYNGLKGIFDNSIIPYEVEDDNYAKKLDKLYDELATNSDKAWDIADEVCNFLDGVFTAGEDLMNGIVDAVDIYIPLYIAWGAECIYNRSCDEAGLPHVSFLSDDDRKLLEPLNAGFEQLVTDPINAVEGMGQQAFDTADEEGWAYASGYVAGDVAAGILLDKGVSELTKGSKVAGEVAEHADDFVGGQYSAFGEMSVEDGIRYRDWNYNKINELSIHNPDADSLTLGKYRPTINPDGTKNWAIPGPDSYNVIADINGDMYFDMKDGLYDSVMENYGLSYQDMFDEFNTKALDKAIEEGKTIRFTHNPELAEYAGSFTDQEWKYLQKNGDYLYLREEGGFWYAEK